MLYHTWLSIFYYLLWVSTIYCKPLESTSRRQLLDLLDGPLSERVTTPISSSGVSAHDGVSATSILTGSTTTTKASRSRQTTTSSILATTRVVGEITSSQALTATSQVTSSPTFSLFNSNPGSVHPTYTLKDEPSQTSSSHHSGFFGSNAVAWRFLAIGALAFVVVGALLLAAVTFDSWRGFLCLRKKDGRGLEELTCEAGVDYSSHKTEKREFAQQIAEASGGPYPAAGSVQSITRLVSPVMSRQPSLRAPTNMPHRMEGIGANWRSVLGGARHSKRPTLGLGLGGTATPYKVSKMWDDDDDEEQATYQYPLPLHAHFHSSIGTERDPHAI
jgi:hypothetical protein